MISQAITHTYSIALSYSQAKYSGISRGGPRTPLPPPLLLLDQTEAWWAKKIETAPLLLSQGLNDCPPPPPPFPV